MRKFFSDMWDLQKHSNAFMKEHWKGYTVWSLGLTGAVMGAMYVVPKGIDKLKDKIDDIKNS